jgi:hypothetical protein
LEVQSTGPIQAGALIVSRAFQPTWNKEWGSGRRPIDTGSREPLIGGGFGIGRGVRKRAYSWTLGDLPDAEVDAIEDIALACGETSPLVVVEDPEVDAGLVRRIHYGLFDRFEAFERKAVGVTRWSLSIIGWV